MSRSARATDAEIRVNFDEALEAAIQVGQWPPSDQGFDDRTDTAVRAAAKAYPNASQGLIDEAHAELRAPNWMGHMLGSRLKTLRGRQWEVR